MRWQQAKLALSIVEIDRVVPRLLNGLYGPFRSRRECLVALREMATAWQLCPKRIGLQGFERRTAACCNVQLKRCRGVCCGREDARQHDLRMLSALDRLRMPEWPWPDTVRCMNAVRAPVGRTSLAGALVPSGQRTGAGSGRHCKSG
jgi:DNA polymerase-3 subunit epsilon